MRKSLYVVGAVFAAMFGAYQLWFWITIPSIARRLSKTEFVDQLRSKYPVGTPEAALIAQLQTQGFGPVIRESETGIGQPVFPDRKYMTFSMWSFPCSRTWWVLWRVNESGSLRDVTGEYYGNLSCL
jgi:hypothetical protein